MGTVALRVRKPQLEWDARSLRFTNSDDANRLIRRTYREGWEVDGL